RAMKPGIIQITDRVLKYFVPAVLTIAALSFLFWLVAPLMWGADPNVQRGAFASLAVLVLGYPCALGMATPLALIRGGGKAADRGILMRSGDAFQIFPNVDHIILDKTGTITVGEPGVSEVVGINNEESDVLAMAASAEAFSEHPLADAILECADKRGVEYEDPETFDSVTGKGVRATIDGDEVLVGKPEWLGNEGIDISEATDEIERLQHQGLTVSGVVQNNNLVGLIGIGDEIKDDAPETIKRM
ncbi:MAG: HAD-IC family P-type ATPase, partial [Halobacteriaceae archaeon]